LEALQTFFAAQPFALDTELQAPQACLPDAERSDSGFGEIFDAVRDHILSQVWNYLKPAHNPPQILHRLKRLLSEMLLAKLTLPGDKRRHQENTRFPLEVISLGKLNQNGNLKDLFVRLDENGQIDFIENFEDGTYVDLFELREYTPSRVHANAQKKEAEEGESELQKGRKYLFTVGRTNQLFGSSPNEILEHCLKKDNGAPAIYPVF
jgi:hypothetical protein